MTRALLVALMFAAGPALAEERIPGQDAFEQGDFKKAAQQMEEVASSPRYPEKTRARAHMYLAAAYHLLGDKASMTAHLLKLAREFPDERMDPGTFDPELVQLADQTRATVQAEREESQRVLASQQKSETPEVPGVKTEPPAPEETAKSVFLRGGAFAMSFLGGGTPGWTVGGALSVRASHFEGGLRVLPGKPSMGYGAEVAYLFLEGDLQPRVALNATYFPSVLNEQGTGNTASAFEPGVALGIRYRVAGPLLVTADAGAGYALTQNSVEYRALDFTLSAGAQVELGVF